CAIGAGPTSDDACVTRCEAAGGFCGDDQIPGPDGTSIDAVTGGVRGVYYSCGGPGQDPVRVPCAACSSSGGSAIARGYTPPGAPKRCPVQAMCTGTGQICGPAMLNGDPDTLYQCGGPGLPGRKIMACTVGAGCEQHPSSVDGVPRADRCRLHRICPRG